MKNQYQFPDQLRVYLYLEFYRVQSFIRFGGASIRTQRTRISNFTLVLIPLSIFTLKCIVLNQLNLISTTAHAQKKYK